MYMICDVKKCSIFLPVQNSNLMKKSAPAGTRTQDLRVISTIL